MDKTDYSEAMTTLKFVLICFCILVGVLWGIVAGSAYYRVWSSRMEGRAELARAESNRQICTLEARAKCESSKALAEAEVIRAEGVARANLIIGDSLKGNDGYLRYLWIQGLQTNNMQVIYVPVEANLPILESSRLRDYKSTTPP